MKPEETKQEKLKRLARQFSRISCLVNPTKKVTEEMVIDDMIVFLECLTEELAGDNTKLTRIFSTDEKKETVEKAKDLDMKSNRLEKKQKQLKDLTTNDLVNYFRIDAYGNVLDRCQSRVETMHFDSEDDTSRFKFWTQEDYPEYHALCPYWFELNSQERTRSIGVKPLQETGMTPGRCWTIFWMDDTSDETLLNDLNQIIDEQTLVMVQGQISRHELTKVKQKILDEISLDVRYDVIGNRKITDQTK